MAILITLILQVHEHRISFHLSVSSGISFVCILQFSVYRFFNSLLKFTCILFNFYVINGIVLLKSFSESMSLVYENAMDFCMPALYPETFTESVYQSNSGDLRNCHGKDHVICNQRQFHCLFFFLFECFYFFLHSYTGNVFFTKLHRMRKINKKNYIIKHFQLVKYSSPQLQC